MKNQLLLGAAYHGNRMPSHMRADMESMARDGIDIVVHMLSHIDWDRHNRVLRDAFRATEEAGLEVWVDNWGLAGCPGDTSHFLVENPECRVVYSNGEYHRRLVCLNQPSFRAFVKAWIEEVASMGVKAIFWDEPELPTKKAGDASLYSCCCPVCQRKFEERYNRPMPRLAGDADVSEFVTDTIVDFFEEITDHSASMGIRNISCLMPKEFFGFEMKLAEKICALPHMDNVGVDPYWSGKGVDPYEFVYRSTERMLATVHPYGKQHNLWVQSFGLPQGAEEEIVWAIEGAYDAGARCILSWSYLGGESNNYRSANPQKCWDATLAGFRRIREMERDRMLAMHREAIKNKEKI